MIDESAELLTVRFHVGNWSGCHAAFGGGLRHRRRHDFDQPRIKWLRDEVLTTKAQPCPLVGQGDRFGYFRVSKFGKRMDGGELHRFIDRRRSAIERATKNEREAQDVIDLVGVIRASRPNNRVRPDSKRVFGHDLRSRIRHGEDQRVARHLLHHVGLQNPRRRESKKDVRPGDNVSQSPRVGFRCIPGLVRLHAFFAPDINDALAVRDANVLPLETQACDQIEAR